VRVQVDQAGDDEQPGGAHDLSCRVLGDAASGAHAAYEPVCNRHVVRAVDVVRRIDDTPTTYEHIISCRSARRRRRRHVICSSLGCETVNPVHADAVP
jgi:hypothetical protein